MSAGLTMKVLLSFITVSTMILVTSSDAIAQDNEPIGRFVADFRGSLVPYEQNVDFAISRGIRPSITPSIGVGLEVGGHVYVFRWRVVTFGVGANFHTSAGNRSPNENDISPDGPILRKKFSAISPQLSFNFGGRNGWSSISGGIGSSRFSLAARDQEEPLQRRANTLNYGGGARWFLKEHLAFSVDLRFYAISPLAATDTQPSSPRMTVMVLSMGAAFK